MPDPRTQVTRWLYGPTKVIRVPIWLVDDVFAFCHAREAERYKSSQRASQRAQGAKSKTKNKRRK